MGLGRQGGTVPYKKKPKEEARELDEDDKKFMAKKKAEEAELKAMKTKAEKGGPLLSGGIRRSKK